MCGQPLVEIARIDIPLELYKFFFLFIFLDFSRDPRQCNISVILYSSM